MAFNMCFLFSSIIFFMFAGEIQGKNENIKFFLTKYEITKIKEIELRTIRLKFPSLPGAERSFEIKMFGNTFIMDLSIFFQRDDSEILFVSKLLNTTSTFLSSNHLLHQGYVRNINNSSVIGYITKEKLFRGYIITDEVFCIEPHTSKDVIVYRFKDVIGPGCYKKSEDEDLDCSESRYFVPWRANKAPPIRPILPNYNLFYDKYLELLHQLKTKERGKRPKNKQENHASIGKHHDNKSKDRDKYKTEKKILKSPQNKQNILISIGKHHNNKSKDHHKNKTEIKVGESHQNKQKNHTDTGKHHDKEKHQDKKMTEKKSKNGKTTISYTNQDYNITGHFNSEKNEIINTNEKNNTEDSNEKRKDIENKKDKNKKTKDDDYEEVDYEEDDEDYDDDKRLRDDDRFANNNLTHQIHYLDLNGTLNRAVHHAENISKNTIEQFLNMEPSLMWKESLSEDNQIFKKQEDKMKENLRNRDPIMEALVSGEHEAIQCRVQVVVGPSLMKKFNYNGEMVIKDIYVQFALLNKIFLKVPFKKRGKKVHFFLSVGQIILYEDEVFAPFTARVDLEYFTKMNRDAQDFCLSIALVNQYLGSGESFDGYTPEGKGGLCSRDGNTLVVSHGNKNTPAPMALYFAALIRGITRAIGAKDKDDQCTEGSYPNPMQVLRDYIINPEIHPTTEYSIFTSCNIKEIEQIFNYKTCLTRVSQPLCGNAILDPGEECDCGPIATCFRLDPCCHAPHRYLDPKPGNNKLAHKSCTLKKSAKCSAHQECCSVCEISKEKYICFSGNNDCDIAMCDGKSASCPSGVEDSNGIICSRNVNETEPLVCKDKKCDQPLCASFDLTPCTCAFGTEKECLHCCMKDGKCRSAGEELQLYANRSYYLEDGTECMGGSCFAGKCYTWSGLQQVYNYTLKKPPQYATKSDSRKKFSTFRAILGSVFSFLTLYFLQLEF